MNFIGESTSRKRPRNTEGGSQVIKYRLRTELIWRYVSLRDEECRGREREKGRKGHTRIGFCVGAHTMSNVYNVRITTLAILH